MKRLLILGSTGSIGTQALDVVARAPEAFELVGLSADSGWESLLAQAREHGVRRIALADPDAAARAAEAWTDGEVLAGPEGLARLVAESGADLVLNAVVGSAGLGPTIVALLGGHRRRAGQQGVARRRRRAGHGAQRGDRRPADPGRLRALRPAPADRRRAAGRPGIDRQLTLTASGGPFRGRTPAELEDVTVEQALQHPTWAMGGKITIDSATLMNKGLEVIEAHHLFGTPYDRIDVVVHPQSIVHALVSPVRRRDARAPRPPRHARPDRLRAAPPGARRGPGRRRSTSPRVGSLTFEPADPETFACLRLAREAAVAGGTAPCVLNAANEVAVHAFLAGRLSFTGIADVIEATLERGRRRAACTRFETLYEADARPARSPATRVEVPRVSWILAFLGFAVLIILHEFGHFVVAKAVGMRVERFSLFFPPLLLRRQGKGETEYAIGAIPLGGYVKISGMNPHEELPPGQEHRAYFRQPVWKRIVVIVAGPVVNIVLAAVILTVLSSRQRHAGGPAREVVHVQADLPANGVLQAGDVITSVDGTHGRLATRCPTQIGTHRCEGGLADGCKATTPADARRAARRRTETISISPVYDADDRAHAARLHPDDAARARRPGRRRSAPRLDEMWRFTSHDRLDDRPGAVRRREAQGGLRRRRLLRDDAPGRPAQLRHRAVRAGA